MTARGRLTRRILALNLIAPALLVIGLLTLDPFRDGLIAARLETLEARGQVIAGALGEAATRDENLAQRLDRAAAIAILQRLGSAGDVAVRLYDPSGVLVADSRRLAGGVRAVEAAPLPPPGEGPGLGERLMGLWDRLAAALARDPPLEAFPSAIESLAELRQALAGEAASAARLGGDGTIVLTVALPVQRLRQLSAVLLLIERDTAIERRLAAERRDILRYFGWTLAVTVALSLLLAATIARPLVRLAAAADAVRLGAGRKVAIPDLARRGDEIGALSTALAGMTRELYRRLDATEAFAADVAHEIRNPLSSLRSAIETLPLTADPAQRERLLRIAAEDVARLDRLIGDIAEASRLDAEITREDLQPVDLAALVQGVIEAFADRGLRFEFAAPDRAAVVPGRPERLGRALANLIDNACSFSPPGGTVRIALARADSDILLTVDDQGPGIPDDELEKVFERFHTRRPEGEAFGHHSGLGLAIARRVIEAHGGSLSAANRRDADGRVVGARLELRLPAAP
ncbi:MAG: HAMP domain-containing protein [Alphaproteobacteria bacterium]|nr:HAMP domain-containing protein [Alphaproteobacteria bacterium]